MKAKSKDDYITKDSKRVKRSPKQKRAHIALDLARESNAVLLRQRDEARELVDALRDERKLLLRALDRAVAQTSRDPDYFIRAARNYDMTR